MKNFFQFLSEASASTAVQQAQRMGLVGDGHGGWYDKRTGEFVAKTEKGQLKFYNKRQKIGQQDPPQSDKEKRLSQTTAQQAPAPQQEPQAQQPTEIVPTQKFPRPASSSYFLDSLKIYFYSTAMFSKTCNFCKN